MAREIHESQQKKPKGSKNMEDEQTKAEESANLQKATEPQEVRKVSLAELSSGEPPEASAHVVGNHVSTQTRTVETPAAPSNPVDVTAIKDKSGRTFKTDQHLLGEDGKPAMTRGGYFKVIPKGAEGVAESQQRSITERGKDLFNKVFNREPAPAKESAPQASTEHAQAQEPQFRDGSSLPFRETPPQPVSAAQSAAAQTVAMEEMLAMMVFSEEWQFLDAERQGLVTVWSKAYEKHGIKEMPLWVEIVAAHGVVITARLGKPKTQEKIGRFKGWFMKKVIDARSKGRKPQAQAIEPKPAANDAE